MQQTPTGSPQPPGAGQPDPEPAAPFGGQVNPDPEPKPEPGPPPPPPPPPPGMDTPDSPLGAAGGMPPSPPPPPPPIGASGPGLNPKLVIAIIVAVLIAVAVAAYFLLLKKPSPQPVVIPQPKFTPSPSPSSGLNPTEQVATLKPEAGKSGSGEASRSVVPGRFVLTVTAELPDPGQGKFYEVWLIRPEPSAQFSAGQLKQSGNRWVLTLDQTRDASAFSNVMVTLETVDDKKPETKVLTGSF